MIGTQKRVDGWMGGAHSKRTSEKGERAYFQLGYMGKALGGDRSCLYYIVTEKAVYLVEDRSMCYGE